MNPLKKDDFYQIVIIKMLLINRIGCLKNKDSSVFRIGSVQIIDFMFD